MGSQSHLPYAQRAARHSNPLVKKLFEIADKKATNVVLSADLTTTAELLAVADSECPPPCIPWSRSPHGADIKAAFWLDVDAWNELLPIAMKTNYR